jgi:adenine-specific DNA-methyltransferase
MAKQSTTKIETIKHDDAKRKNIPSAEQQSFVQHVHAALKQIRYPRNSDLLRCAEANPLPSQL